MTQIWILNSLTKMFVSNYIKYTKMSHEEKSKTYLSTERKSIYSQFI